MSEVDNIKIPKKFDNIVRMDLGVNDASCEDTAGRYDFIEDIIHLNPKLMGVATIAE